ncbi:GNAT family N-acetyltransferase [Adhaeretor mobilis]|uniref:Ribosomal-protein-alanine N-acetyltransferase n=1 Tax=Adhaeretor mobilis TaxID=1930276 RepID=A0A517MWY2_9BACT|nr:GNAT family N-acetyltransferase [Adhaeretor mobilis]QDS99386.1 ribosomal-protein-alanine N-acetyltransferase [Adhaeretor mobilis]
MRIFNLQYHKRYRMEADLRRWQPLAAALHPDYRLVSWSESLLAAHAEAKYYSFRDELDGEIFPSLGNLKSCERLMGQIRSKKGFVPEATWLAQYAAAGQRYLESSGTVQAIRISRNRANIQNVGVTPLHRYRGLGLALVNASLTGMQQVGVTRVYLEVTARNKSAVNLYQRVGFRKTRTLYKAAERNYSEAS